MSFDPSAWSAASTEGPEGGEAPPPGLYEVSIETAEVFQAKSSGDDFIRMAYKVMVGPLTGHEWSEVRGLTPKAVPVQKAHCKKLGIDVDKVGSLDDLDAALRGVVGGYASVKVKKNGQYLNTDVVARHSGPVGSDVPSTVGAGAPAPPAEGDDDIPFRAEYIVPKGQHLGTWSDFA